MPPLHQVLDDEDWETIIRRIEAGKCTPFVGAGMSAHRLPAGGALAETLAARHGYPFPDRYNLARVAQYAAVKRNDDPAIKEQVAEQFALATQGVSPQTFNDGTDPHRILAELPFTRYFTTNYDRFIELALASVGAGYESDVCPWNEGTRQTVERWREKHGSFAGADPAAARRLVYHLHGELNLPESMVLTDDDYLDFLAEIVLDPSRIRKEVSQAFAESSVLFLGYSLTDITFRVIFRTAFAQLQLNRQRAHLAVQLPPRGNTEGEAEAIQDYLEKYLGRTMKVRFFWGTAQEFTIELKRRWVIKHPAAAGADVAAAGAATSVAPGTTPGVT